MSDGAWVPNSGDIVWLDFDPQAGHEQGGSRPALVLSPHSYNRGVGLAIVCPITGHAKGYPFEVPLPPDLSVRGVVLSDHVKSLDWFARRAKSMGSVPEDVTRAVLANVLSVLGLRLP